MARVWTIALALGLVALAACGGSPPPSPSAPTPGAGAPTRSILYVTASAGFRHDVLPLSQQVLRDLGQRMGGFNTIATEDVAMITRENLAKFDAIAFFTTGELPIDAGQKAALLD